MTFPWGLTCWALASRPPIPPPQSPSTPPTPYGHRMHTIWQQKIPSNLGPRKMDLALSERVGKLVSPYVSVPKMLQFEW